MSLISPQLLSPISSKLFLEIFGLRHTGFQFNAWHNLTQQGFIFNVIPLISWGLIIEKMELFFLISPILLYFIFNVTTRILKSSIRQEGAFSLLQNWGGPMSRPYLFHLLTFVGPINQKPFWWITSLINWYIMADIGLIHVVKLLNDF